MYHYYISCFLSCYCENGTEKSHHLFPNNDHYDQQDDKSYKEFSVSKVGEMVKGYQTYSPKCDIKKKFFYCCSNSFPVSFVDTLYKKESTRGTLKFLSCTCRILTINLFINYVLLNLCLISYAPTNISFVIKLCLHVRVPHYLLVICSAL